MPSRLRSIVSVSGSRSMPAPAKSAHRNLSLPQPARRGSGDGGNFETKNASGHALVLSKILTPPAAVRTRRSRSDTASSGIAITYRTPSTFNVDGVVTVVGVGGE